MALSCNGSSSSSGSIGERVWRGWRESHACDLDALTSLWQAMHSEAPIGA